MDQFVEDNNQLQATDYRTYFQPINKVADHQLCGICLELAIEAVECLSCETLYCKQCAMLWKQTKNECPKRCKLIFDTKSPHRVIREQLSQIECVCINSQNGCDKRIRYDNVIKHIVMCEYQRIECETKCGWTGLMRDLKNHQLECGELKFVLCQMCDSQISLSQMKTHNCVNDLKQQLNELKQQFQDYKLQSEKGIQYFIQQQQTIEEMSIKQDDLEFGLQQCQLEIRQLRSQQNQQKPDQQLRLTQSQQTWHMIPPLHLVRSSIYKCKLKGHQMHFWQIFEANSNMQICTLCKSQRNCRYVDLQCKHFYCLNCIPVECDVVNNKCISGHSMTLRASYDFICDICSIRRKNFIGLNCRQCNFDMCDSCIKLKKYRQVSVAKSCPIQ